MLRVVRAPAVSWLRQDGAQWIVAARLAWQRTWSRKFIQLPPAATAILSSLLPDHEMGSWFDADRFRAFARPH
jgi:hypothetical protein